MHFLDFLTFFAMFFEDKLVYIGYLERTDTYRSNPSFSVILMKKQEVNIFILFKRELPFFLYMSTLQYHYTIHIP